MNYTHLEYLCTRWHWNFQSGQRVPGQDLAFAFVDLAEVPASPFLPCVKVTAILALPPAHQPFPPSLKPLTKLPKASSILSPRLLLKSLNGIDSVLTCEGYLTGLCSAPLPVGKCSQFSTHLSGRVSSSGYKGATGDCVKGLSNVNTHNIHCLSPCPHHQLSQKANGHNLSLVSPRWLLQITFLPLQGRAS